MTFSNLPKFRARVLSQYFGTPAEYIQTTSALDPETLTTVETQIRYPTVARAIRKKVTDSSGRLITTANQFVQVAALDLKVRPKRADKLVFLGTEYLIESVEVLNTAAYVLELAK